MADGFCVVCGRTDRVLEDGVCPDCFAARTPLVRAPTRPTVVLCPTCGARRVGAHWEGRGRPSLLGSEDLVPLLEPHPGVAIRSVAWTDESTHPLLQSLSGVVTLRFRGTERTEPVHLNVKVEHRTCPECSRRSGHFYTATLQLRASEDAPREKAVDRRARIWAIWESAIAEARSDWQRALSWAEELPEGWDLYFTDTLAARALAKHVRQRVGASLKESATLWGRKHGQDVYRVTFCLRFPDAPTSASPARRGRAPSRPSPAPVERQA